MYLKTEEIEELEELYGQPEELEFGEIEMQEDEFWLLKKSMEGGRAHDVTAFIFIDGRVVGIQKPVHPPGVYRAPSGGVKPGEDMEEGIKREIYEETGLKIEIDRYLLRIKPTFTHDNERRDWTSHIFLARKTGGKLGPKDTDEIKDVRLVPVEELQNEIRKKMVETRRGGLIYRARLTDAFLERAGKEF